MANNTQPPKLQHIQLQLNSFFAEKETELQEIRKELEEEKKKVERKNKQIEELETKQTVLIRKHKKELDEIQKIKENVKKENTNLKSVLEKKRELIEQITDEYVEMSEKSKRLVEMLKRVRRNGGEGNREEEDRLERSLNGNGGQDDSGVGGGEDGEMEVDVEEANEPAVEVEISKIRRSGRNYRRKRLD